jgi:hypothetical protein
MTRKEYYCDLCHDRVFNGKGLGISFTADGQIVETRFEDTDRHICERCIKAISEIERMF